MPVNTQHRAYKAHAVKWQRCRDVAEGQDAVQAAGEKYLPRLQDQPVPEYNKYKMRASFYNASWRTIAGLLGMIFSKPVRIEVPDAVKELLEDVDGAGTPIELFIQDNTENAITVGRVGVLVDYPQAPDGVTLADAQAMNLRPTLQLYQAESIVNWRVRVVNNRKVPVLVVLKESEEVIDPKDEYVLTAEDRWRVLDLIDVPTDGMGEAGVRYRQRLYKIKGGKQNQNKVLEFEPVDSPIFPLMNNKPLDYIPFYANGTDDATLDDVDDPPLIDLVDVNLGHYRITAIYEQCLTFSPPTLFLTGYKKENPNDKVYVGSGTAIISSNENAKGSFIEYTGGGLSPLEKALAAKEQQMAILGARMLEPMKKGVETADTASIHRKGEESLLSSIAKAISLCMTAALKTYVEWAGFDPTNVLVSVNDDFHVAGLTAVDISARISAWQQGAPGFSDQSLFDQMQKGEVIAPELTLEDEQARIAERQQQLMDQQVAAQAALSGGQQGGGGPLQ